MRTGLHPKPHNHKGKRAKIGSTDVQVVDWFDRVTGGRWQHLRGENTMANGYANRLRVMKKLGGLPKDDEVVVIMMNGRYLAVHDSELDNE